MRLDVTPQRWRQNHERGGLEKVDHGKYIDHVSIFLEDAQTSLHNEAFLPEEHSAPSIQN